MPYLQQLTFDDPLLNMATVLVAGIIGGEVFARIKLPKVTGWIATGILLRQLCLPGMDVSEDPMALDKFKPFMSFVLGFIAVYRWSNTLYQQLAKHGKKDFASVNE